MEGTRLTFLPAAQEGARRRAGAAGPRWGRGRAAAPTDSCSGPTEASTPRGARRAAWGPGRPRCPESVWGAASAPLLCPRRPEGLEPGGLGSRERASPWEQVLRLTPVSTSLWGRCVSLLCGRRPVPALQQGRRSGHVETLCTTLSWTGLASEQPRLCSARRGPCPTQPPRSRVPRH